MASDPGRPGPRGGPGAACHGLLRRLDVEVAAVPAQLMIPVGFRHEDPTGHLDAVNIRWLEDRKLEIPRE